MDNKISKEIEKQIRKENSKGQNRVWLYIKDNIAKLALIPISITYIIYGLFMIEKKEESILNILASISISIVMGTAIAICMMNAGFNDAKKTQEFKDKNLKYYKFPLYFRIYLLLLQIHF